MKQLNEDQRDALQNVIKKAAVDEKVRKQLLNNPATVLRNFGIDVSKFPTIRFVENEGADMTVVLPNLEPALPELSEEELEQIAGGGVSFAKARTTRCARGQLTCCHTHVVVRLME